MLTKKQFLLRQVTKVTDRLEIETAQPMIAPVKHNKKCHKQESRKTLMRFK